MLLVMLIKRGRLREKGRGGQLISSIDQLMSSTASELVGIGKEPLFRLLQSGADSLPLTVKHACDRFRRLAQDCGLPYGSFHALRHDFAAQMSILFDDNTARMMLHHDMQKNTLSSHYTGGILNYNLLALRAGELATAGQKEKMQQSTYREQQLLGPAHRAVAGNLSSTGARIKTVRQRTNLAKVPTRGQAAPRSHHEIEAEASKRSPVYASLAEQFDRELRDLETLVGVSVAHAGRSFRRLRHKFQSAITPENALAQRAFDNASLLYEQMNKIKVVISKQRAHEERRAKTARLAGQSADSGDVLSVKDIRSAESAITARRHESSHQTLLKSHLQLVLDKGTLGDATSLRFLGMQEQPTSVTEEEDVQEAVRRLVIENGEETAARDDATSFMQSAVLDDSSVGTPETRRQARDLRIQYLQMYESIWDAPKRLGAIVAIMIDAGFCPFCPDYVRGSLPLRSSRKSGLFDPASASVRSSVQAHLYSQHPTICVALRAGQLLHPGALESYLLLGSRQSPWFAADSDLEKRFLRRLASRRPRLERFGGMTGGPALLGLPPCSQRACQRARGKVGVEHHRKAGSVAAFDDGLSTAGDPESSLMTRRTLSNCGQTMLQVVLAKV